MNKYNVKMPTDTIRIAVKALNEARQELKRLNDQKADYKSPDANRRYTLERIERELARIAADQEQITADISKKISGLCDTMQNEQKAAFVPNGQDLIGADNEADVALFRNGLIMDQNTLDYLVSKHDNAAFRILAANYAKARDWHGYDYITNEDHANEYITEVIRGLKSAAASPFGYNALRFTETKGEYHRMADAYGLSAEFAASNGDAIDNAVIDPIVIETISD